MNFVHRTNFDRYAFLDNNGHTNVVGKQYLDLVEDQAVEDNQYFADNGAVKIWFIPAYISACKILTDEVVFAELFKLDKYKHLKGELDGDW